MKEVMELCKKVSALKNKLYMTDYKANRDNAIITLGIINGVDKSEMKEVIERFTQSEKQRQAWRDEINALEIQIKILKNQ